MLYNNVRQECLRLFQFFPTNLLPRTITTAYSMISTIWNNGLLSGRRNSHPTKCFVLSLTLRTNSSHFSYRLSDTYLEEVKYYKYLGVYITSSLSWSLQCEKVKTKANKILGVLHPTTGRLSHEPMFFNL